MDACCWWLTVWTIDQSYIHLLNANETPTPPSALNWKQAKPSLLVININCEAWPWFLSRLQNVSALQKIYRNGKKTVPQCFQNENCGSNDLSLMPFYLNSFQWRILRGTMAVQRDPIWCPRAFAKSWTRRTRPSQLSRTPPTNSTSLSEVTLWAKTWLWFCSVETGLDRNLMPSVTRSLQATTSVIHCVSLHPNVSFPHVCF